MLKVRIPLAISLIASALGVSAIPNEPAKVGVPQYVAASHYTAVLHQASQRWQVTPLDGSEIEISTGGENCATAPAIPKGIWLVTQGENNQAELLAPSGTVLPAGHPGYVRLVACGEAAQGEPALALPQTLIDWLAQSSGAILVDD